jgi:hypothetical protein
MNKLEKTIKSKDYQEKLQECFSYLGFSIVDNKEQQKQFEKDFIEYEMSMDDPDNKIFKTVLNNAYWFWVSEDDDFFGLYFHPTIKEFNCIVQLDNEWSLRYRGSNTNDWIEGYFKNRKKRNIPEQVIKFKNKTEELNSLINTSVKMDNVDLINLYKNHT